MLHLNWVVEKNNKLQNNQYKHNSNMVDMCQRISYQYCGLLFAGCVFILN